MRRRLGREDLRSVSPLLQDKESHTPLPWRVYEEYEIVDQADGLPYIAAVGRVVDSYYPLVDTPHLFLEFARTVENRNPAQALWQWVHTYGLLGLAHKDTGYFVEEIPEVVFPPREYDASGGPGETVDAHWYYAELANEDLVLYEAALNRDAEKLERVLYPTEEDQERGEQDRHLTEKKKEYGADWTDRLIGFALRQIWEDVGSLLNNQAYPTIGYRGDLPSELALLSIDRLTASWDTRSLLGAMYLQFYWLVTSAGNLSRCKHCGRIMSYAPPIPGSADRKPRKDKEFCSRQCRQNYHYQNRVKPARKRKSA